MKWIIFFKWSTTTKMESQELQSGKSIMKSMEIEDHMDAKISNGWKKPWRQWWRLFVQT
jgi:hypothetical protein